MVESLELKVDSRETSLGNFGSLLPNLTELKLSGSNISSARYAMCQNIDFLEFSSQANTFYSNLYFIDFGWGYI